MAKNAAGSILTCSKPGCTCQLRVEKPCRDRDTYWCACGHEMILQEPRGARPPLRESRPEGSYSLWT